MEPGPIPTLTASAPASTKYFAASAEAILPTTTSSFGNFALTSLSFNTTPLVCPCAVSITIASTPASTNFSTRATVSSVTPTAAATLSLPRLSLHEIGCSFTLIISLYVISPINLLSESMTGSFSIRFSCKITSALLKEIDSNVVIKFSEVITSTIGL